MTDGDLVCILGFCTGDQLGATFTLSADLEGFKRLPLQNACVKGDVSGDPSLNTQGLILICRKPLHTSRTV